MADAAPRASPARHDAEGGWHAVTAGLDIASSTLKGPPSQGTQGKELLGAQPQSPSSSAPSDTGSGASDSGGGSGDDGRRRDGGAEDSDAGSASDSSSSRSWAPGGSSSPGSASSSSSTASTNADANETYIFPRPPATGRITGLYFHPSSLLHRQRSDAQNAVYFNEHSEPEQTEEEEAMQTEQDSLPGSPNLPLSPEWKPPRNRAARAISETSESEASTQESATESAKHAYGDKDLTEKRRSARHSEGANGGIVSGSGGGGGGDGDDEDDEDDEEDQDYVDGMDEDGHELFHGVLPNGERLISLDQEHPEKPARVGASYELLKSLGLADQCYMIPAREAARAELALIHTSEHLDTIDSIKTMTDAEMNMWQDRFDDIFLCNDTPLAARFSCGGVIASCEAVWFNQVLNAFALVRPPGHHAEFEQPYGFCIYSNVAVATQHVKSAHGVKRVMIVDWDIHHGNGTQDQFYDDPDVLFISMHRYETDFFPDLKVGASTFIGGKGAKGRNVNIAWPCIGFGDSEYMRAFHEIVMPLGQEFQPELVIVSAGFDAAYGDELGKFQVTPTGYAQMTHMLKSLANGKLVLALEGGYHIPVVKHCVAACVSVLLGSNPAPLQPSPPHPIALETLANVKRLLSPYWNCLRPQEIPLDFQDAVDLFIETKLRRRRGLERRHAEKDFSVYASTGIDKHRGFIIFIDDPLDAIMAPYLANGHAVVSIEINLEDRRVYTDPELREQAINSVISSTLEHIPISTAKSVYFIGIDFPMSALEICIASSKLLHNHLRHAVLVCDYPPAVLSDTFKVFIVKNCEMFVPSELPSGEEITSGVDGEGEQTHIRQFSWGSHHSTMSERLAELSSLIQSRIAFSLTRKALRQLASLKRESGRGSHRLSIGLDPPTLKRRRTESDQKEPDQSVRSASIKAHTPQSRPASAQPQSTTVSQSADNTQPTSRPTSSSRPTPQTHTASASKPPSQSGAASTSKPPSSHLSSASKSQSVTHGVAPKSAKSTKASTWTVESHKAPPLGTSTHRPEDSSSGSGVPTYDDPLALLAERSSSAGRPDLSFRLPPWVFNDTTGASAESTTAGKSGPEAQPKAKANPESRSKPNAPPRSHAAAPLFRPKPSNGTASTPAVAGLLPRALADAAAYRPTLPRGGENRHAVLVEIDSD
ncbi:Histone deacetylase hda1 [Polyrhizophydium stewartii]|uniref:histone deacetylase n=1 Tax=Polyrhizophydium stewartii TaxID=2732419 RepID=A0ABR4N3D3_9FUNG